VFKKSDFCPAHLFFCDFRPPPNAIKCTEKPDLLRNSELRFEAQKVGREITTSTKHTMNSGGLRMELYGRLSE